MSVLAYGQIVRRSRAPSTRGLPRAAAQEGESKLVTAVAALVPAEILAAHAFILSKATKLDSEGTTTITNAGALQLSLPGLFVLALIVYLISRGFSDWQVLDFVRLFIPAVSFLVWTALIGTSALSPWLANLAKDGRAVAPEAVFAAAIITAVLLIAVNTRVNPPK
ncbi:MAG: hypothetical protein AABM40_04685 [Chloroflexota bacterium]